MATPALRVIQDQNQNVLYSGATPAGKTDVTKTDKKGGQGVRKALNDISNSRKPSALHSVKKDGSLNVIPIDGKDPRAVKGKSKAQEKGKAVGRKALSDLTNSVKPPTKQVPGVGRKLKAIAEDNVPSCIMDEGFLHNHQECIKAQKKAMDMDLDHFLKTVGLSNDIVIQPSARRARPPSPKKAEIILQEISEDDLFEDRDECKKSELRGFFSPPCRSPESPKAPYMSWDEDDIFDLKLIDSPEH